MGCDIHQKVYVWSKIENKYVDSHETSEHSVYFFKDIIEGRNYTLFGIIAGVRSDFMTIENRNTNIPAFMSETFKEYLRDGFFHSFTWYYIDDFRKELLNTKEKLLEHLADEDFDLEYIVKWIDSSVKQIDEFIEFYSDPDEGHSKIFDPIRTVIFFYFDS